MKKARAVDCFPKRETTSSKDNDGPKEVVEVLLSKDTSTKE